MATCRSGDAAGRRLVIRSVHIVASCLPLLLLYNTSDACCAATGGRVLCTYCCSCRVVFAAVVVCIHNLRVTNRPGLCEPECIFSSSWVRPRQGFVCFRGLAYDLKRTGEGGQAKIPRPKSTHKLNAAINTEQKCSCHVMSCHVRAWRSHLLLASSHLINDTLSETEQSRKGGG